MHRRRARFSFVLLLLVGMLPPTARATTTLPFPSTLRFYSTSSLINDQADGYLFAVGRTFRGGVASYVGVVPSDGSPSFTITGFSAPTGLAISGSQVFVAESGATSIGVIDASTSPPKLVRRISTSPFHPMAVAVVGTQLFFSHDCSAGGIAEVDADGQSPAVAAGPTVCDRMVASPAIPHTLFLSADDAVERFDTTTLPLAAPSSSPATPGGYPSIAVVGSNVLALEAYNALVDEFDGSTLSLIKTFSTPNAQAIVSAPNDTTHFFIQDSFCGGARWRLAGSAPQHSYVFQGCVSAMAPNDDGTVLHWSTSGGVSGDFNLAYVRSLDASRDAGPIAIAAPPISPYVVTWGNQASLPVTQYYVATAGDPVQLWGGLRGKPPALLDEAPVDADGNVTFQPIITQSTAFYAYYLGSATAGPGLSDPLVVLARPLVVDKMLRSYGTSGKYALYHQRQRVFTDAVVHPDETGRKVTFTFQYHRHRSWVTFSTFKHRLQTGSKLVVYFPKNFFPTGTYRFQVRTPVLTKAISTNGKWAYWKVTR